MTTSKTQNKLESFGGACNNSAKLKRKHRYHVCSLLATGYLPKLVVEELKEVYGITCSESNIRDTYLNGHKWQSLIRRLQEKFNERILEHPLAQKSNRLTILQKAITEALSFGSSKTIKYSRGKIVEITYKRPIGAVASLIKELRIECEGEKPNVLILSDNRKSLIQEIHHHYNGKSNGAVKKGKKQDGNAEESGDNGRSRLQVVR